MIRCGKLKGKEDEEAIEQCILYTKDGSKAIDYFPYSEHGGEEGAKKATEKRERAIHFFKNMKKAFTEAAQEFGAPAVLKYVLDTAVGCEACEEVVKAYVREKLPSWVEKAEKKQPGFKEVWESDYGGSVTACMKIVGAKVSDPGAYCAWLKDHVTGTTKWRGREEKSLADSAEEALTTLRKDETDIGDLDLSELEAWLSGTTPPEGGTPVTEEPPVAAELTPTQTEPVPEPDNDFRAFLLRDHAERQAGGTARMPPRSPSSFSRRQMAALDKEG